MSKVRIRDNSVSAIDSGDFDTDEIKRVVIYTTTRCSICKKAKAYFDEQGIGYDEYDVEKDPRGKKDYKRMGGRGVPIILVGSQRMNGFTQKRFDELYSAAN